MVDYCSCSLLDSVIGNGIRELLKIRGSPRGSMRNIGTWEVKIAVWFSKIGELNDFLFSDIIRDMESILQL